MECSCIKSKCNENSQFPRSHKKIRGEEERSISEAQKAYTQRQRIQALLRQFPYKHRMVLIKNLLENKHTNKQKLHGKIWNTYHH